MTDTKFAEGPIDLSGFDVTELIEEIFEKENKKPWTRTVGLYHPSSIGPKSCQRSMYYDRVGEEPKQKIPAGLRMLFGLGHAVHDVIQGNLEEHEGFKSEVPLQSTGLNLVGHCDGVFTKEGWVLEIKTIGDASFRTLVKPKEEHSWQVHCYMYMLGIPRAQILYVNRNTGSLRNFKVKFDHKIWNNICELVSTVESYVENEEPAPRTVNKFYCKSCKFLEECNPF